MFVCLFVCLFVRSFVRSFNQSINHSLPPSSPSPGAVVAWGGGGAPSAGGRPRPAVAEGHTVRSRPPVHRRIQDKHLRLAHRRCVSLQLSLSLSLSLTITSHFITPLTSPLTISLHHLISSHLISSHTTSPHYTHTVSLHHFLSSPLISPHLTSPHTSYHHLFPPHLPPALWWRGLSTGRTGRPRPPSAWDTPYTQETTSSPTGAVWWTLVCLFACLLVCLLCFAGLVIDWVG